MHMIGLQCQINHKCQAPNHPSLEILNKFNIETTGIQKSCNKHQVHKNKGKCILRDIQFSINVWRSNLQHIR